MKSIELKPNLEIEIQGATGPVKITLSTLGLINNCLDNPPDKGYSASELAKIRRIEDQIKKQQEEAIQFSLSIAKPLNEVQGKPFTHLELEDADYEVLRGYVMRMTWGIRHRYIQDFTQQILSNN